jgi:hypothetical protein
LNFSLLNKKRYLNAQAMPQPKAPAADNKITSTTEQPLVVREYTRLYSAFLGLVIQP